MATIYNKIVESVTEPSIDNLWLKEGKLYYYKGGWKPLTQEENVSTEDLKLLISEYSDGRQAIATALTNRRYPTQPTESFHAMADKITNMSYEEGWFAKIGYTDEKDGGIQEAIDYAYELAKGWNPDGSTAMMFKGNTKLLFLPQLNWGDCVATGGGIFDGCSSLCFINGIDVNGFTSLTYAFRNCGCLQSLHLDNTHNIQWMEGAFANCSNLRKLSLDMSATKGVSAPGGSIFSNCSNLVFIAITNLGKATLATYDFSGATVWGTGGEENRQSLIDSLITYSYDRASNGMSTATIKLSETTKALLTEEEIAQITNKGFTIA